MYRCNKCIYLTEAQLGVGRCCRETLKRQGMHEEPLYLRLSFAVTWNCYKTVYSLKFFTKNKEALDLFFDHQHWARLTRGKGCLQNWGKITSKPEFCHQINYQLAFTFTYGLKNLQLKQISQNYWNIVQKLREKHCRHTGLKKPHPKSSTTPEKLAKRPTQMGARQGAQKGFP